MLVLIAIAFMLRCGLFCWLRKPTLLSLLLTVLMCTHLAAQTRLQPIVTSDEIFYVPFTVPAGPVESQPKIVELFVSGDEGKSWTKYQQRNPKEGRFSFRAGVDGEFWFAVRTIDTNGQPSIEKIQNAELIVIVDRNKPQLNVATQVGAGGQIRAEWTAADASLTASDLKLEYRLQNEQTWRSVDVQSRSVLAEDGTMQGQTSWWTPAGTSSIDIRAFAKDRAGNVASVERSIQIISAEPPPGIPTPAQLAGIPLPASLDAPAANAPQPVQPPQWMATQGPVAQSSQATTMRKPTPRSGEVFNPYVNSMSDVNVPPDANVSGQLPAAANSPPADSTTTSQSPIPPGLPRGMPANPSNEAWQNNPFASNPTASPADVSSPLLPTPSPLDSTTAARSADRNSLLVNSTPQSAERESASPIQPGPNGMLISKSRRFNLDYGVETAGTDGVYRIEVWFTDDGGRTWRHHGDDEDRVSPYLVDVPNDGLYGFRLIVQGKEGFAARPPRNGDPADVWIAVDDTSPTVKITTARYGRGTQTGMLHILWEARDKDLMDRPITLLYSAQPAGPWRKIASELPNTGRYDWQVDDRVPDLIYLRIEALDRAGNSGADALIEPIRGAGLAPRGHIHTVRPASHQQRFGSRFFDR